MSANKSLIALCKSIGRWTHLSQHTLIFRLMWKSKQWLVRTGDRTLAGYKQWYRISLGPQAFWERQAMKGVNERQCRQLFLLLQTEGAVYFVQGKWTVSEFYFYSTYTLIEVGNLHFTPSLSLQYAVKLWNGICSVLMRKPVVSYQ